jgi:hypothetical protein
MRSLTSSFSRARHNDQLRWALFASIAATLAFLVSAVAPIVSGVVAAITALLTTRSTFHESIQEGGRQVIGTIAGAAIGGLLLAAMGFSPLLLVTSLGLAFGIGRILRLGNDGSITIGVTVILVLGLNLDGAAVESRILGVVAGAAIALTISLFVFSERPQDRALRQALDYSQQISSLLADIGGAMRRRGDGLEIPSTLIEEWLDCAQDIQSGLESLGREAEEIAKGVRWSPLIQREEAEHVLLQCRVGHELAVTVAGMCRELLVTRESTALSDVLALGLSEVFDAAAGVIENHVSRASVGSGVFAFSAYQEDLQQLMNAQESVRGTVKDLDETGALILGSSLLQDGVTIAKIAAGDAQAGEPQVKRNP